MKLVGIIVAFNPVVNQFLSNIEKLILEVDQLLVYRNSKIENETMLIDKFGDKLVFLGSEINNGIGEALNAGVYWAKNKNFTHILTLDQDSYFEVGHLLQFRQLIENSIELKNVGVYVPNFINRGVIYISKITTPFEVSDSITSGSIIPINLFNLVKGFNNFLFIDGVDSEFCFRIKKEHGLKTVIFPTIHLIHELGDFKKSAFGFYTVNYSAFRTFYLVRNHILLSRKYPNFYSKKNKLIILRDFILYRILKIILSEKDKTRKIRSIIRGIFHGLKYRL